MSGERYLWIEKRIKELEGQLQEAGTLTRNYAAAHRQIRESLQQAEKNAVMGCGHAQKFLEIHITPQEGGADKKKVCSECERIEFLRESLRKRDEELKSACLDVEAWRENSEIWQAENDGLLAQLNDVGPLFLPDMRKLLGLPENASMDNIHDALISLLASTREAARKA